MTARGRVVMVVVSKSSAGEVCVQVWCRGVAWFGILWWCVMDRCGVWCGEVRCGVASSYSQK